MAWIKNNLWTIPFLFILSANLCYGQDTLPAFTAVLRSGNKVQINWINNYGEQVRQLSIQRSRDSSRLFKTIVSIPDPKVLRNGYIDSRSADSNYYYRLYILLDSGRYIFSTPRKPDRYVPPPVYKPVVVKPAISVDEPRKTSRAGIIPPRPVLTDDEKTIIPIPEKRNEPAKPKKPVPLTVPVPEKFYAIKRGTEVSGQLQESRLKKFRDSVSLQTKDTIAIITKDTIFIKPFIVKDIYKLSKYIFIDKSGVVHIELPEAAKKKYQVKIFEEDKTLLFEVKDIRDQVLLLDKANFQHAGWFLFEIFDDGNLMEKNRFYISKDF